LDFATALETVTFFLSEKGYSHAVIGGVALAAYGMLRTTIDLDFVVEAGAQEELIAHLESLGYQTLHRSSGYSNHLHPDPARGRVDFVYVRGETSRNLFAACRHLPGPRGRQITLPKPEHLAALKAFALKNDPGRTFQEMADVRFLLQLPGVSPSEIRRSFARHGIEDRFDEIQRTLP
jgi:hypothetical protein